ncbi:MAG: hypothetical protein HON65_11335 [Rhodospirillales bacterium]|jgi:hypothetical protein|nr:hypothetical protein [Rhodospirillales bacterium]
MPFVVRDAEGNIAGVYNQPVEGGEELAADNAELLAFIQATAPATSGAEDEWVQADLALARVLEDLIDVLIEKNMINFTDFPEGAQKKLLSRRGMRKEMTYVASLFEGMQSDDSDGGGFL